MAMDSSDAVEEPAMNTLGDSLIPIINKLQDIFNQVTVDFKLNLPQVAVVGSQSSGKSSVLEALVGRDFLPRGTEIVTRRPLVLQLVKTPAVAGRPAEWGEFLHLVGKVFTDFSQIRAEIQQETERVVGTNKNVSDKPIRLKIFSPNVLTMTLVDLPGMTRVPVGDQPTNIEQRIRDMVMEIIRQPNCIVLAVSPANADLANSDALQVAQLADPDGTRTIGVLTKLDIMDRGTSAAQILRNQHIPLRLGYVGVVLRAQEDINRNKSMLDARRAEEVYFANHAEYRDMPGQVGTATLARKINTILVSHIRHMLPSLRRRIHEALEQRTAEMRGYGDPQPLQTKSARGAYLLQLLCDYAERYAAMLEGRHQDLSMQQLSGGARIREVFNEQFAKQLRAIYPARDVSDDEILTVIKNGAGATGNLLVPQEPFELLVRRAIKTLLSPAVQCKQAVYEEMLRIAEQACPREAIRFPHLQKQLAGAMLEYLQAHAEPADRMIRSLVDCEHDYINCDHPEFIGGRGAVRSVLQDRTTRASMPAAAVRKQDGGESTATVRPKLENGGVRPSLGLKAVVDGASSSRSHEDVPRVRRHSDDSGGDGGTSGAGGGASWFSWFGKGDRYERALDDSGLPPPRAQRVAARSEQDEVEVEVIRRLVENYFEIVRRNVADQVPKAIMHFLVNNTKRGLQQHLIHALYRDDILDDLLLERDDIVRKRAVCQEALEALQAAMRALDDVPSELSSDPGASHNGGGGSNSHSLLSSGAGGGSSAGLSTLAGGGSRLANLGSLAFGTSTPADPGALPSLQLAVDRPSLGRLSGMNIASRPNTPDHGAMMFQ